MKNSFGPNCRSIPDKVVGRIKRLTLRTKCLAKVVTVTERESAMETVTRLIKIKTFGKEIRALEAGKNLPPSLP